MSAGSEALAETARLEAAAFYGWACGDTSAEQRRQQRVQDELAWEAAMDRQAIRAAAQAGASVHALMTRYSLTRAEARDAIAEATS